MNNIMMNKYIKTAIKACEKASINIRRDINEVLHLQNSRNLKNFLFNTQLRFEKNMSSELSAETYNITLLNNFEESKNIYDVNYTTFKRDEQSNIYCSVIGVDNMINLSHGLEQVAFSVSFSTENSDFNIDTMIGAVICIPIQNSIIYSDQHGDIHTLGVDGISRKLRINQSVSVILPSIVCGFDHNSHESMMYLKNRNLHFVSSGSILCDAVRVLENKVDVVFYTIPNNLSYLSSIRYLIQKSGGADAIIGNTYVFGKKSIISLIMQNYTDNTISTQLVN